MKAPSVREGSKKNGTQVTGNRIYKGCLVCQLSLADQAPIQFMIASTPGAALGDGKKLVDRFMAGKPKIAPQEPICKNSPRCRSRPGDGGRPSMITPRSKL